MGSEPRSLGMEPDDITVLAFPPKGVAVGGFDPPTAGSYARLSVCFRMPYKDREKRLAAQSAWLRAHPHTRQQREAWKQRQREIVRRFKAERGCSKCHEQDPICLDFHHPDPSTKDVEPGNMIAKGYSAKRILEETASCVLLCSNCHRKEHWLLRQQPGALPD